MQGCVDFCFLMEGIFSLVMSQLLHLVASSDIYVTRAPQTKMDVWLCSSGRTSCSPTGNTGQFCNRLPWDTYTFIERVRRIRHLKAEFIFKSHKGVSRTFMAPTAALGAGETDRENQPRAERGRAAVRGVEGKCAA